MRLVAALSLRRLGFDPWSVHMTFVVDKAAFWQVPPSRSNSVFLCQWNPTDAPNTFVYYRRCTNSTTDSVLQSRQKKRRDVAKLHHATMWDGRKNFKRNFICSSFTEYENRESLWLKLTVATGNCHRTHLLLCAQLACSWINIYRTAECFERTV